jgi:hypothetical protein
MRFFRARVRLLCVATFTDAQRDVCPVSGDFRESVHVEVVVHEMVP